MSNIEKALKTLRMYAGLGAIAEDKDEVNQAYQDIHNFIEEHRRLKESHEQLLVTAAALQKRCEGREIDC